MKRKKSSPKRSRSRSRSLAPVKPTVVHMEVVEDPMNEIHRGVNLVGKAVKAVNDVVDFLEPHIDRLIKKSRR